MSVIKNLFMQNQQVGVVHVLRPVRACESNGELNYFQQ